MSSLTNQPDNMNYLSPLGFRFLLQRAPNVMYFCQAAQLPTVSLSDLDMETPLAKIPFVGDRILYEPLSIRFKIDEDLKNYLELFNWMEGLGHPEDLTQYKNETDDNRYGARMRTQPQWSSDATLMILTSNHNANIMVTFEDMFPISLSPLQFDTTLADIEHLEADALFKYRRFTIASLN
jgi:hypothetical protein